VPNWNANAPEVLGNEYLATHAQVARVWAGAAGRMQRLTSTVAETISSLKMSATVNPLSEASIPTVIDVVAEGSEFVPLFKTARLTPNADKTNEGWKTGTGGSTNLYATLDDDTTRWPGPAQTDWVQVTTPMTAYSCSFNAALFAAAGAAQNGRIGMVGASVIMSSSLGYRKMGVALEIGGVLYPPAAGGLRDVHQFGAIYSFWWGELNPATGNPWVPADIANFGSAGTGRLFFRSQATATATAYPRIHAASLNVAYATTENRLAVGVWRRPEDIGDTALINAQTTSLITLPAGTAGWSKPASGNHLYLWRQSISPSEYGATVGTDVRWNGSYQDLGPGGQPPGTVFPLHHSGVLGTAPATSPASDSISYDHHGRPLRQWWSGSRATYGLALVRSDTAISVDSQPYRLTLADLAFLTSTQKLGQRITPAATASYLGVRFPIIPPATGNPTLTAQVYAVSGGAAVGGSYSISAATVRALPKTTGGIRYIHGVLASGASLTAATAYEVRLTTTAGGTWIAPMPDTSLGSTASFGGNTNGAFIGATHYPDRELSINLTRQPNPPTGVGAAITNVAVTVPYLVAQLPTIQHVAVSWTPPASGMGGLFSRYEIDRNLDATGVWQRVANVNNSATASWVDHEVPRGVPVQYRVRVVGTDGRFSVHVTTGTVTPASQGQVMILTSNHRPDLELVYLYDREATYPILSASDDEVVPIHGADYQVVFVGAEDRGVGLRTTLLIHQVATPTRGGINVLKPLRNLLRAAGVDIPYVCVLDNRSTHLMGHVGVTEATQKAPAHRYGAPIEVTPTESEPVPVELT
jgi:hypothetical protein